MGTKKTSKSIKKLIAKLQTAKDNLMEYYHQETNEYAVSHYLLYKNRINSIDNQIVKLHLQLEGIENNSNTKIVS